MTRVTALVAGLGLVGVIAAPAANAKTPVGGGKLTVCKFVGPGVSAQKRFHFKANGRSFTLAAKPGAKGGCTTMHFEQRAKVRIAEQAPAGTRAAISARPAKALVERDPRRRSAVIRLAPGGTRVNFTNVVCDEGIDIKNNEPVLPPGATDVESPVDVDIDRGLLSDVYPGVDTTTDGFYPLPCDPSIGGTLPPEVNDPPSKDEIEGQQFVSAFEATKGADLAQVQNVALPPVAAPGSRECAIRKEPKAPVTIIPCDSDTFLHDDQPFEGRDVIYIHGLGTDHLVDRLGKHGPAKQALAQKTWPADAAEFLNPFGYFRTYAEDYWQDHIREHLFDPVNPANPSAGWQWTANDAAPVYRPKANRYLTIAWSSIQTIEYAQHAMLTQIQRAIATNLNVHTPPTYPTNEFRPFCSNGCIVVSHSTGSLITSTAMSRAAAGDFGPGGAQIAKRIRTHVSFAGAISGNRLASLGLAVAFATSPVPVGVCAAIDLWLQTTGGCQAGLSFLPSTVLRDLVPMVAKLVWGPVVEKSPVPTLATSGGHPIGNFSGVTKWLPIGLDDGVISANSSCGNPNPALSGALAASGARVTSLLKAFEMSKSAAMKARAIKNFISHKDLQGGATPGPSVKYLAASCTPYRSPTGMVMPIENPFDNSLWSARNRYSNHYSMLQGSFDHAYDGGSDSANPWGSSLGKPAGTVRQYLNALGPNVEETGAVTDSGAYKKFADGTYLLHPAFAKTHEVVRGKKITFKIFKKKFTKWIWKRTFHLLDKWEIKQSSDYAYEFVGKK